MTNFQKLKILVVCIVIILIFSVSGVYASWIPKTLKMIVV